jgi:two-component system, NarL family, sensor kinase
MTFKVKITLLALIPLVFVAIAMAFITHYQAGVLSAQEVESFRQGLLDARKRSLSDYVSLAKASVQHVVDNANLDEWHAREQVKAILNGLKYGHKIDDGYFFVYDQQGTNLVHPDMGSLVGTNLYQLQDDRGDFVIQSLLRVANSGGGFYTYRWKKPSTGEVESKISYVTRLDRWGWMMGTGFYLDDVVEEVTAIERQVEANISGMFYTVLLLAAIATIPLVFLVNWRETRLANARIQESAHRFVTLQVNERRRFARELHDGVSQLLVAAKYRIGLVARQAETGRVSAPDVLRQAGDLLSEAVGEIRHISHGLRPALLDDMGLEIALNNLVGQFSERNSIACSVECNLKDIRLPADIDISLYRIVQEALGNVEKHAAAGHLWVKLFRRGEFIVLDIKDDGAGFSTDQLKSVVGIGIRNMRERAELLGGIFSLESSPGAGTRINIELPLERKS